MEEQGIQTKKLISNQALHKMLAASVAGGHLCHAYLFYGEKGIGKRTLAENFARMILCRGEFPRPCERCPSCHKFLSGNHPDFAVYEGKGGANSLHIEAIRELRSDAYIRPNDGEYKVYLILNAEELSIGAANALLKVLEEPPAHAVFLLTANNRDMVPLTVRSRCIQLELYPMSAEETAAALRRLLPESAGAELESAAELSGGVLGRALDILENEEYADLTAISRRIAAGLARGDEYEILAAFAQLGQGKEKMTALLSRLSAILRTALLHKLSARTSGDRLMAELAMSLTASQIDALSELLEEGARAVDGNVNLGLLQNYLTAGMMKAVG